MKHLILAAALALFATGCNNHNQEETVQQAKEAMLDSINRANQAAAIRQHTIDSMNLAAEKEKERHHHVQATANPAPAPEKKGMNNTKKGALIGAGAGAVTGAVTGAVVSGDKGKGALIGGLIGAAAGAGAGAITGKTIDKKKESEKK